MLSVVVASFFTLLWEWLIVRGAGNADSGGKKRRYVRDDRHQGAGQRALIYRHHGDDDVILVPHMEGIWVGMA